MVNEKRERRPLRFKNCISYVIFVTQFSWPPPGRPILPIFFPRTPNTTLKARENFFRNIKNWPLKRRPERDQPVVRGGQFFRLSCYQGESMSVMAYETQKMFTTLCPTYTYLVSEVQSWDPQANGQRGKIGLCNHSGYYYRCLTVDVEWKVGRCCDQWIKSQDR